MTTRRRSATALAVLLGLALTTGGCSMFTGPRAERTPVPLSRQPLAEIKVDVKAIEADLASFVPAETVQAVEPSTGGSILTCSNGGASWASNTAVRVSEAPDFVAMADRVRSEWARAGEFTIDMWGTAGDGSGFVLTGYGAQNYFVGMLGDILMIDSFGPCFELVPERDGYPWDIRAE